MVRVLLYKAQAHKMRQVEQRINVSTEGEHRRKIMIWRLYDSINGQWYSDELYATQEACVAAAEHYMQEARAEGEVLELLAEALDDAEAYESLREEEEP